MKTQRPAQLPWYVNRPAWPIGVAVLAIAVATIMWLVKPKPTSTLPSVTHDQSDLQDILAMQQQRNKALQSEISSTKKTLDSLVCDTGKDSLSDSADSGTDTHTGANSGAKNTPVAYTGKPLKSADLHSMIVQAVVLVVGEAADGGNSKQYNTGTGFFVSATDIVTNAHVVDGVSSQLMVYSDFTKKSAPATVIHTDYKRSFGGRDYALLRVTGMQAPGTLRIGTSVDQLMEVVSAGYPGVYREVISGLVDFNQNSVPPFIMTDGIISSISTSKYKVPTLSHTAEIHGGNSGGPLVNRCGAVVGINTFTATPGNPPAKINFALGSADLASYLSSKAISARQTSAKCE